MKLAPDINHKTYINKNIEEVYYSLTTASEWNGFFTANTTIDLKVGGYIHFKWENFGPDRVEAEDLATILEIVPNEKLVFNWSPGKTPTTVTITLQKKGEGTIVEVTETGYSIEENSLYVHMTCATGWGECLTLFKFYLEHGVIYGEVPI